MAIQALFRMGRGARVDIDELDSPNGSHLAYRPHDRIIFPPLPGIVSRLSADCLVRSPCGRRCRQIQGAVRPSLVRVRLRFRVLPTRGIVPNNDLGTFWR